MRTIGLLGGMSWESTALYYKLINESVRDQLGPLRSASLLLYSFDFEVIKSLQHAGDWQSAGDLLAEKAVQLEAAGADAIVLCTNTMHKVAQQIADSVRVPFLHLADGTARRIAASGHRRVALLGTRFTMEQDFYADRLRAFGLEVRVPERGEIDDIHRVIYDELCAGIVKDESRDRYRQIILRMADQGSEAVILGCTEITMLIAPKDVPVPTFDTTAIHAEDAAEFIIGARSS